MVSAFNGPLERESDNVSLEKEETPIIEELELGNEKRM